MSHAFTILLTEDIVSVLKKVEAFLTESGGRFEGDAQKGIFHGHSAMGPIKGEYCSVSDQEVRINITGKPFIVPYSLIESEIRKYFSA